MEGYLFWGAEYWLARERGGDPSYLRAFARARRGSASAASVLSIQARITARPLRCGIGDAAQS